MPEETPKIIVNGTEVDPASCKKVKLKEHMTTKAIGKLIVEKRKTQNDSREK